MLKKLKLLAIPVLGISLLLIALGSFDFKLGNIFFASAATESVSVIRQDCTGYSNCYTSLASWETAQQKDLVASNEIAVARIEGPWTNPDTTAVTIDGWTTGPDNYVKIYTTPEARHSGVWNTGKYRLEPINVSALIIQENYVKVDGLQIGITSLITSKSELALQYNTGGEITISNNLIQGSGANSVGLSAGGIGDLNLFNNIIYNTRNQYFGGVRHSRTGTLKAFNNTIINSYYGIRRSSGTVIAKNNIVINAISSDYLSDNSVAWGAGSDHNISSDGTSTGGANDKINQTVTFADYTNNNYHLASSDTSALNAGIDLSADPNLAFITDVDGETRSGSWDIGADEYAGASQGGGTPPPPSDTTAPVRSGGSPSGDLAAGTTQATLALTTDENATCKYGTAANTAYTSIANTFSTTGTISHSASISTQNGQSYLYHIKCVDGSGNANIDDYTISFSVANPPAVEPIASSAPATATTTAPTTTTTKSSSAPIILYTDITSGPNTGGENNNGAYLSIFGKNFGNNIADVKVYVGNGEIARYMYLGASLGRPDIQQLSVQLGPNTATGAIKVVVNGVDSNTDKTFTVRPGNFYYISHSGSNTTGVVNDFTKPFRTGWHVWQLPAFKAGDFLVIMNDDVYDFGSGNEGLYTGHGNGAWTVLTKSGENENNPITIYGYPGSTPTIFQLSNDSQYFIKSSSQIPTKHIVIANIKVNHNNHRANALSLGFYSSATDKVEYPRLVNYWASNCLPNWNGSSGVSCISLQNTDYLKMYGVQAGPQGSPRDSTNAGHVIYQSHRYTDGDTGWIYIHDFEYGRAAYQLAGDAWASVRANSWGANTNVRIHDSLFKNLPQEALLLNLGSKEIFVYNNVFDNAVTKNNAFAAIAFRGADLNSGDYYFYNNTVYTDAIGDANYNGIIQMGYSPQSTYPRSVNLHNNIIYSKSTNSNFYSFNHSLFTASKVTSNNNIWHNSNQNLPFLGVNDKIINPQFINPASGDFRLQSTSPAIDAGASITSNLVTKDYNSTPRPQGSSYDIGAYEYYEGTTITTPTTPAPTPTEPTPPSDTTAPVISSVQSATTTTSATIIWTTNENASSQVEYGLTTSYGQSTAVNSTPTTSHSRSITSLSPNTTYNYRVISRDAAGNTAIGQNRTFRTAAASDTTAPAATSNLTSSNISQSSLTLTWTAPSDNSGVTSYDLRYSASPITSANFSSATAFTDVPSPRTAGFIEQYVVVGLTPGTTYYFAIKSTDSSGNISDISNIVNASTAAAPSTTSATPSANPGTVSTPSMGNVGGSTGGASNGSYTVYQITDATPPATVTGAKADTTDGQISLSWTNPTDSDFVRVKILRKTDTYSTSATDGIVVYGGKDTSFIDTGLANGTTHYYTIYTYDSVPNYSLPVKLSATPQANTTQTSVIAEKNLTNTDTASAALPHPAGTLLRDSITKRTYYIDNGGVKRLISSPTAFSANGFSWSRVIDVSGSVLGRYADGSSVSGKIATATSTPANIVRPINPGQSVVVKVSGIPAAMKKAVLVKVKNTIYAIINGKRHAISSPSVFNAYEFSWSKVKTVPTAQLNRYPRVKLVKAVGSPAVFYITDRGQKKVIPSAAIFLAYNNRWTDIVEILPEDLAKYPDVKLIRLEGDTKIYLLENNSKHHIRSMDVLTKMKLKIDDVVNVKKIEFDVYPTGEDVR